MEINKHCQENCCQIYFYRSLTENSSFKGGDECATVFLKRFNRLRNYFFTFFSFLFTKYLNYVKIKTMEKTTYMVHVKQVITKLVNIVAFFNNEHRRCSFVADASSETLNDHGLYLEKSMDVGNNINLIKMTECLRMSLDICMSVLQASSFRTR